MVKADVRMARGARVVVRFDALLKRLERRERRTIGLREVQAMTGIDKSRLVDWSKGRVTRFDADKIVALCDFFGCRVGELIKILPKQDGDQRDEPQTAR